MSTGTLEKFIINPSINVSGIYYYSLLDLESGYVFQGESHPFYELNYVISGELGLTCDNRLINLRENQVYVIPPDVFHKNWVINNEKVKLLVISFELDRKGNIPFSPDVYTLESIHIELFKILSDECKHFFVKYDNKGIDGTGRFSLAHSAQAPLGNSQLIKNILEIILLFFLREAAPAPSVDSLDSRIYFSAIEHMTSNIDQNLTIANIARYCRTSPSSLKNVFRKYVGKGIIHYFIDMKIEYSKSLLLQEYSIADISEKLSFSSQAYFSTTFKRLIGMSPFAYKKSMVMKESTHRTLTRYSSRNPGEL